jgi:hypothetical protein
MKAKEYAAQLIAAENPEAYESALFAFLDELVYSTIATMKQRASAPAALACIRETFTKWKSIVAQVKAAKPELVIDQALFVKYFSAASTPLFTMAVEGNAFLGYTPDAEDREVIRKGESEIKAQQMRDRLVEMTREARALGIDPKALLGVAVLRGEIDARDLVAAAILG